MNRDDRISTPQPARPPENGGPLVELLLRVPREFRRLIVVIAHLLIAIASSYLAFSLRFDGKIPAALITMFLVTLPWLVLARGTAFFLFHLEEGMWRYAGLWELRRIAYAVSTSTVLFFLAVRFVHGTDDYPRSIFLIDAGCLLILMGGFRLMPRVYRELGRPKGKRRLLIFGAGDTGERALRQLLNDPACAYEPVGFVDDDRGKSGQRIHGVPVLGSLRHLPQIIKQVSPHEVMVAIPHVDPALVRELVSMLEPFDLPITTVVLRNGAAVAEVRSLSIEDLLSRPPVGLDVDQVRHLIEGKRVLVTGAGGSIGSELSRQIAALHPALLVLFERYENGLYDVDNTLRDGQNGAVVRLAIGDVTDQKRLEAVFRQYRPEIVFHAAAHKHVPLMELNPCEAVKNNVTGTRLVAEAAVRHGVERFILISTDKAVNPSSVMGASKRVAELVLQRLSTLSATRFVAVRFGNVLGSNGSVLLRFQDQVKAGGPVTVTDPAMTRYFMLIPEAVQLVLHAAAIGAGGDTLVLDMGEQIRVLDLARNVIRLSGRVPEKDIPIVFTGLRPGEKLYEELAGEGELVAQSSVDKILRIVSEVAVADHIAVALGELERQAAQGNTETVLAQLGQLVPTFRSISTFQPAQSA